MRDPKQGAGTRRRWWFTAAGCLFALLASTLATWAQDAGTPDWGVITRTEMRDHYADDPMAGAVVVFDKGFITVGPGFQFTYERHRRIQIFGQGSYHYGNVEITLYKSENLDNIEAHTLTPNGDRIEISHRDIHKTETGDMETYVFAFPEVSPGAVLEYRYKINSNNFYYLRPWTFQNEIPTEYSELTVRLPEGFEYEVVLNNSDLVEGPDTALVATIRQEGKVRQFTWRSRDLSRLVGEPCVLSLLDHRAQLDFQIVRYRDNNKVWEFVDSWADLARQVRNLYKPLLKTDDDWPRFEKADGETREELANRVYRFVRDSVALSGEAQAITNGLLPAEDVFEQRRGNSLEKNLLLVSLLRHNGFHAYPILISRRDHLRFDRRDHRLFQFNHALALVEIDSDQRVFCDANTPAAWMGYLPPESQVDAGVVIGHPSIEEVVIDVPAPPIANDARAEASVTLRGDGSAFGRIEGTVGGEAAYELLRALGDHDTVAYLQEQWLDGAIPTSFEVKGGDYDYWSPITFIAEFEWPQAATVDNGRLFLRPSILRKLKSNPLMTKSRRYPISFDTPWSEDCRIRWTLPEDFELTDVPASREVIGDGFEFHSSVVRDGNQVISSRTWNVNKRDFPVTRFRDLRELFNTVQLSEQGLMVLYHDTL
ncbi:MAG: DUF3857 domain-containing protein [candidate division Zixibacteria bacterium]|nr:DUF3857 domain-containing protein [candidate division Zixibacteria bacterium]